MNKINIAELLKDCPKGMELDCTVYDNCTLETVFEGCLYPIQIQTPEGLINLTKYGSMSQSTHSKCVIFPKDKTTWEGFHRPFRDGDIITCNNSACTFVSIFKYKPTERSFRKHCSFILDYNRFVVTTKFADYTNPRFATEEEKQKLFQAIKDNGYKWNDETKTLEKLSKFKIGDRIKYRSGEIVYRIVQITKDSYVLDNLCSIPISIEHMYNLVPNKFDINTLKPFEDKVLVRNDENQKWLPAFWGYKVVDGFITTFGWCKYCIPYNGNETLFKTNNDCDDFYKTWEK